MLQASGCKLQDTGCRKDKKPEAWDLKLVTV